jgi:serine/arginine repetitive matrix protein 2
LKSHDSHALAAAKELEMNKMGRAFGIGSGHVEGKGFNRKDADAERIERYVFRLPTCWCFSSRT